MKNKRARLSASRRAAVLVLVVVAVAALAAGVYLIVAPDGAPESPAASAAELTDPAQSRRPRPRSRRSRMAFPCA